MPAAADRSGFVDAVGDPGELAHHVVRYFADGQRPTNAGRYGLVEAAILADLKSATGVNFEDYKPATVRRRIEHRMHAIGATSLQDLAERVAADGVERAALTQDILIGVSAFFRDAQAFEDLAEHSLPELIRAAAEEERTVRVWVAGCATGQEAYSLAIALIEARDDLDVNPPIKIFATDVHNGSLVKGREGVYTDEEVAGLNPERLARFFRKEAGGWRAKPELRGTIAFSNHNLLMDAPFTRIDLMSCRNTLIYFTQKSQRNAFWAFGFALRNGGTLMLGESEALGVAAPDFAEIAPPSRLFRKLRHRTTAGFKRIRRPSEIRPVAAPLHAFDTNRSATGSGRGRSTSTDRTINAAHEAVYAAEGVGALLISESKQLMQVLGEASEWLEFPSGPPPDDVMRLIKDVALRGAVGSVFRRLGDEEAPEEVVSLRNGDASRQVVLRGLHIRDGEATHALVYAKPHVVIGLSEFAGVEGTDVLNADHLRAKVAQLESDLEVMTRQLQTSVQQQESTYDEVSAANEQLVVSNEELQTSIEELSSVNEELRTVADENEHRLQEVLELGADLEQSLDATNIGLILLNADLVIRRFSKPATNFFHLISSDVGRPFNHIRAQFVCENLMPAIQDAADVGSSVSFRIEPTEQSPRTLLAEVRPYELTRGELGLSISIVDITKAQRREEELEIISDRLTAILEASNVAVWERSLDSTTDWVSDNFAEVAGFSASEWWTEFPQISSIHVDDIASMRDHRATQQALAEKGHVGSLEEVSYRVKEGDGYRTMSSRAAIGRRKDKPLMSGLVIDVTDDRAREMQLEALNDRLLQVNESLDDFNRVASHDLRSPLRAIRNLTQFVRQDDGPNLDNITLGRLTQIDERVDSMNQLLDDLLEYANSGGQSTPRLTDLKSLTEDIFTFVDSRDDLDFEVDCDVEPIVTESIPLATCIRNLVSNAAKHHPGPNGRVSVTHRLEANRLIVTVQDDGGGIAEKDYELIFEPFRGSGPTGTGLGLAIVRRVLQEKGGSVSIDSVMGEGTQFRVEWPLLVSEPNAAVDR